MCGRFTLTVDPADLQDAFGLSAPAPAEMAPRYNIAPSQPVAVVPNQGERRIDFFTWGLVPAWARDPAIGNRMINARSETAAEKPAFRAALKRRRCLIPADGFYEWKKAGRTKTPMLIQMKDGQPFALAGLWEIWHGADGSEIRSCTILTTTPNSLVEPIHDRMPVILPPAAYETWLTPGELPADTSLPLLKPYPASRMKAVAVSTLVNNPRTDTPECVKPA